MPEFASGCLIDPAIRDATVVDLLANGRQPICADNASIKGTWARLKTRGVQAVMLPQLMFKYFPGRQNDLQLAHRPRRPNDDNGTCVSRGTYRSMTLSYLRAIDEKQIIGRPVVFSYEAIFGGGRVQIGKGRLGTSGGMYGGWAARWASEYGGVERAVIGQYNLSQDTPLGRSDLATLWGNRGVPQEIIDEARKHPFDAHLARTPDEAADCLAAGFAGAFSRSWAGEGQRDSNGMVRPSPSAHCETLCGIFRAHNGEDGFLHWQSWGEKTPSGNNRLKLYDGSTYELPNGCYGVYASDVEKAFRGDGESWHFECREGSQYR